MTSRIARTAKLVKKHMEASEAKPQPQESGPLIRCGLLLTPGLWEEYHEREEPDAAGSKVDDVAQDK